MKINEKQYGNGISLGVIDTKKFKTGYFSLTYVLPMNEYNASHGSVLANVLERGCKKYPGVREINRKLCEIYDASVSVSSLGCSNLIAFKIGVEFLDSRYVLDGDVDVFGESLDFIKEMLFNPLEINGELDSSYVASEKNRVSDAIRAEINNKDRLAIKRCTEIAYEGTPLAVPRKGTLEGVEAATPGSLYAFLKYITEKCKLLAVFSGDMTERRAKRLDGFLAQLSDMRDGTAIDEVSSDFEVPLFESAKEVVETTVAKQGRMVLNYSYGKVSKDDEAPGVFVEIFGASPVSRLFMNVRERLSLCYYCSAAVLLSTARVTVNSGLDIENREKAIAEIQRQIELLSSEENISDEELMMAKLSRVSNYTELKDSCSRYAEWYIVRRITENSCDVDAIIERTNAVTKTDVAKIARSLKLQVSYFLKGEQI